MPSNARPNVIEEGYENNGCRRSLLGKFARSIAYSTNAQRHLLNVPAGKISAFAEDSGHFLQWLSNSVVQPIDASGYYPRSLYGSLVGYVINCTGAGIDFRKNGSTSDDRLIQSLIERKMIVAEEFGLGLKTDAEAANRGAGPEASRKRAISGDACEILQGKA